MVLPAQSAKEIAVITTEQCGARKTVGNQDQIDFALSLDRLPDSSGHSQCFVVLMGRVEHRRSGQFDSPEQQTTVDKEHPSSGRFFMQAKDPRRGCLSSLHPSYSSERKLDKAC
jgi:hypothetical protein